MHRGPLHYAFDISRSQKVLARNAQQPLAVDLEFDATEAWQYAIDPATLVFHGAAPKGGSLPSPVFDSGLPPFTITATACPISWGVAGDTFAAAPPTNPACTGPATNITLWPFGVSGGVACPWWSVGLIGMIAGYEAPYRRVAYLQVYLNREITCPICEALAESLSTLFLKDPSCNDITFIESLRAPPAKPRVTFLTPVHQLSSRSSTLQILEVMSWVT